MSEFASRVAELDGTLKAIRAEIESLRAALEIDDNQLSQDLTRARGQGAMLRDLIGVQRPDAKWTNRSGLDQVLVELAAAEAARLKQQRRNRLLELADELDAGTVKHRFEARASSLNALRLEAVKQLRAEADSAGEIRELPGPPAIEWLPWICNLQEEQNASTLEQLHRDFPALERFAGDMEESYWSSARAVSAPPADPPVAPVAEVTPVAPPPSSSAPLPEAKPAPPLPPPSMAAVAAAAANHGVLPPHLRMQFDQAMSNGNYAEALSLCYDSASTAVPAAEESSWRPLPATEPQSTASLPENSSLRTPAAAASAARLNYCDKCGSSYSSDFHTCPDEDSSRPSASQANSRSNTRGIHLVLDNVGERGLDLDNTSAPQSTTMVQTATKSSSGPTSLPLSEDIPSEAAGMEFQRLRAIVESNSAAEDPALAEEEEDDPRRKEFILRVVAASAIMLLVIVVVSFFFTARFAPKSDKPAAEAVKLSTQVRDTNIQKEITQKLAVLKGSSIQVTVQDGVATLAGQAASNADAAQASAFALQASGVKAVTNNIQVDAAGAKSPPSNSAKQ